MSPKFFFVVFLLASLGFSGCKKPTPPTPPTPTHRVVTTSGILDWSDWQKWIQAPPRIVLTDNLDLETRKLIAKQTKLFNTLITEPRVIAPENKEEKLKKLKDAFINTGYNKNHRYSTYYSNYSSGIDDYAETAQRGRTITLNVPHYDRWDRYRGAVQGLQFSNLTNTILLIERQSSNDLKDLSSHLNHSGVAGAQARADSGWIQDTLTPLITKLKLLDSNEPVINFNEVDQAREEWQRFEENQLRLIKRVITERTKAEAIATANGSFNLAGQGRLCAIIKVAERELYFPANTPNVGLRFLNVRIESEVVEGSRQ